MLHFLHLLATNANNNNCNYYYCSIIILWIMCTGTHECPVEAFKDYARHRPPSSSTPDSRFYLQPMRSITNTQWFSAQPMGRTSLGNLAKSMSTAGGLPERRTNHSARKTAIKTLLHANVPPTEVMQLSGHRNVQSLNSYSEVSTRQQQQMSSILSSLSDNHPTVPSTSVGITDYSHPASISDAVAVFDLVDGIDWDDMLAMETTDIPPSTSKSILQPIPQPTGNQFHFLNGENHAPITIHIHHHYHSKLNSGVNTGFGLNIGGEE